MTPTGSAGSGSGCLVANPCSLESATDADELNPGDTISLAAGSYVFSTDITIGTAGVTLVGAGADKTYLSSTASSGVPLTLAEATVVASDFSITAVNAGPTIRVSAGTMDRVAAWNTSAQTGTVGCQAVGSIGQATISNSICGRSSAGSGGGLIAGLEASGAATIVVRNSTVIGGDGSWAFALLAAPSTGPINLTVSNTIMSGQSYDVVTQFASASSSIALSIDHSNYSTFTDVGDPTGFPAPGTATNQTAEPVFAETSFYTQASNSPTIDAGQTYVGVGLKDLLGAQRNQGAAIDIGASEFASPIVNPPVDTTAPIVTITKRPKSGTSKKARVSFNANEPATFQCKLDKARTWKSCSSPWKKTVKVGKHKLRIRATDTAGNVGASKTVSWTVKKKR